MTDINKETSTNGVPFHMQGWSDDTSDSEQADGESSSTAVSASETDNQPTATTGGKQQTKKKWHWKPTPKDKSASVAPDTEGGGQKVGVEELKRMSTRERKQARIGKVELDPNIDYADWTSDGPGLESRANLDPNDGMINIWVDLKQKLPDLPKDYAQPVREWATEPISQSNDCPPLNIVIFIVGSRGDVQPYLSLALHLIRSNGHRVRIATHPDFKDFVLDGNKRLKGKVHKGVELEGKLEFYDVGGSPKELMAFMVKNPGLLPGWEAIRSGDISSKRQMTGQMLQGFYHSCFEPNPTTQEPFAADAIISNPPTFAHIHIAEALGLPLLLTFTMPWSPSTAFKHPLVNIKATNAEAGLTNYFTFALAEMLQWQGLGDVINLFRTTTLGLEPLTARNGPGAPDTLKIPWTYCWSEGLIAKPEDWKEHIDISGFYFLEGEVDFKPDEELVRFLEGGEAPIYIGFGSVVVEDAEAMTKTIFEAVEKAGVRALVSAGWGGLGGTNVPKSVFILKGSIPHDWLFADGRVSAVCHHGGAGTTAIGLRNGLPTIVIPFFGDQKFWGDMIHRAGAGPEPIPQKTLTPENLSEAIKFAISPAAKTAAGKMGEQIRKESGEVKGVESFHRHLPLRNMRCEVDSSRVGVWWSDTLCLRLSGAVAGLLVKERGLKMSDLKPLRPREYDTRSSHYAKDPITGGSTAILHAISNHYTGIAQLFYNPPKGVITTAMWVPQGLFDLVDQLFAGFDAIPGRIGSSVRERGDVENFGQGVREAGKGLFYGWWDGITGLAVEPFEGAKKEGALGFIKGAGRSYVNVTARPAAGILGTIALPIRGAWKSLRQKTAGQPSKALRKPREELSISQAETLSPEEKKILLEKFDKLNERTSERKAVLRKRAKLILRGDERGMDPDADVNGISEEELNKPVEKSGDSQQQQQEGGEAVKGGKNGENGGAKEEVGDEMAVQGMKAAMGEPMLKQTAGAGNGNTDGKTRDEVAEAERRGYERALKEFQAKQ